MKSFFQKLFLFPRNFFVFLITLYQETLSPDHGLFKYRYPYGFCRFYPSCSEYSRQAIKKYGIMKGIPLSLWRIVRCNPWSKGGVDEVNLKFKD